MRLLGAFLALALLCQAPTALAAFSLAWKSTTSNEASQNFLETVGYLLPQKMRTVLAGQYSLEFGRDFKALSPTTCENENLARTEGHRILLNPALSEAVVNGFSHPHVTCRRTTDYNLAMGALVHELAIAYDNTVSADQRLAQEKARACASANGKNLPSALCSRLRASRRLVSDRSPFLHLMNFDASFFGYENKQRDENRSEIDPRFLASPQEAFAAAMEGFALNPQFACEHPGIWNFIARHFDSYPKHAACAPFTSPLFESPGESAELNPARVYQVNYLYAEPGQEIIEQFGHAMVEVIACAPEHEIGPACTSDKSSHYVLTFYGEGARDLVEGMTGKATAKLFINNIDSVEKRYAAQNRALQRVPLRMNPADIAVLLGTAWEWNRSYAGRWYDLTNNCVTHAADLLRAALPEMEYERLPLLTPGNLANFFRKNP